MAQTELIHLIDDEDRKAAQGAAERIQIKSTLAHEVIVDQLIERGIDPETATSEKLQISKELKDITATPERAKRQLASEGVSTNSAPMIVLHMGGESLSAQGAGDFIEGELVNPKVEDMPELNEEWGL
jgi:hypothetical protein